MDKKKVNINEKMMHELPVSAYTSKEWFDIEMKHLFSTTWQFAGFVEDVLRSLQSYQPILLQ